MIAVDAECRSSASAISSSSSIRNSGREGLVSVFVFVTLAMFLFEIKESFCRHSSSQQF